MRLAAEISRNRNSHEHILKKRHQYNFILENIKLQLAAEKSLNKKNYSSFFVQNCLYNPKIYNQPKLFATPFINATLESAYNKRQTLTKSRNM